MRVARRSLLGALAALPLTAAVPRIGKAGTMIGSIEKEAAETAFGAAVRPEQLFTPSPLRSTIARCDILVPEYHGQWSAVEWRKGDPWFGNYDAIVSFAELHGQTV